MRVDSHRLMADRLLGGYRAAGMATLHGLVDNGMFAEPNTRLAMSRHRARVGLACGLISGSLTGFLLPPSPNELALVAPTLTDWLGRTGARWSVGALLTQRFEPLWWPFALVGRGKLAEGVDTLEPPDGAGVRRPRAKWAVGAEVLVSYGLLGLPQYLLDYAAARCSAASWPKTALACGLGAALIALALELPRFTCTVFSCVYMAAWSVAVGCTSAAVLGATSLVLFRPARHRRL